MNFARDIVFYLQESTLYSRSVLQNETESLNCQWGSHDIGVGSCVQFLDLFNIRHAWGRYSVLFALLFFLLLLIACSNLLRHIREYINTNRVDRIKLRHPFLDARNWCLIIMIVALLLMLISFIDAWGFYQRLSLKTFLGLYSVAYALMTMPPVFMSLHIYHDIHNMSKVIVRKAYGIFIVGIFILIALYGTVGYPAFGIYLAVRLGNDPTDPDGLGIRGNILAYVSYGLLIFFCSFNFINVYFLKKALNNYKQINIYNRVQKERITVGIHGLLSWTFMIIVIAAIWMIQAILADKLIDQSLRGLQYHVDFHVANRAAEVLICFFTLGFIELRYITQVPFIDDLVLLATCKWYNTPVELRYNAKEWGVEHAMSTSVTNSKDTGSFSMGSPREKSTYTTRSQVDSITQGTVDNDDSSSSSDSDYDPDTTKKSEPVLDKTKRKPKKLRQPSNTGESNLPSQVARKKKSKRRENVEMKTISTTLGDDNSV